MGTRLKFLGLAVFFAMVAFLGAAFVVSNGNYVRWWLMLISGAVFCVLSLVGMFCPGRMQWLMDGWQKQHSKDEE